MATELIPASHSPTELVVKSASPTVFGQSEYIPVIASEAPDYEGPYEADAHFYEQTFPTNLHLMRDDFSVHAINYTEAPNDSGITVTIGG